MFSPLIPKDTLQVHPAFLSTQYSQPHGNMEVQRKGLQDTRKTYPPTLHTWQLLIKLHLELDHPTALVREHLAQLILSNFILSIGQVYDWGSQFHLRNPKVYIMLMAKCLPLLMLGDPGNEATKCIHSPGAYQCKMVCDIKVCPHNTSATNTVWWQNWWCESWKLSWVDCTFHVIKYCNTKHCLSLDGIFANILSWVPAHVCVWLKVQ